MHENKQTKGEYLYKHENKLTTQFHAYYNKVYQSVTLLRGHNKPNNRGHRPRLTEVVVEWVLGIGHIDVIYGKV